MNHHQLQHLFSRYLFLYFVLLISSNPSSSASLNDLQRLLAFKSKLSDSALLHTWVSTSDLCSFGGVSCKDASKISSIALDGISLGVEFRYVVEFLLPLPSLELLSMARSNLSHNQDDNNDEGFNFALKLKNPMWLLVLDDNVSKLLVYALSCKCPIAQESEEWIYVVLQKRKELNLDAGRISKRVLN